MDDETKAALTAIDGKLDTLIKNNADEQVAGLLGKFNDILSQPIVRGVLVPAGVVAALAWLNRGGYLTPEQQTRAAEVVIAAADPGGAPGVLAPQPAPVAAPVAVPADVPAPMAPTE